MGADEVLVCVRISCVHIKNNNAFSSAFVPYCQVLVLNFKTHTSQTESSCSAAMSERAIGAGSRPISGPPNEFLVTEKVKN